MSATASALSGVSRKSGRIARALDEESHRRDARERRKVRGLARGRYGEGFERELVFAVEMQRGAACHERCQPWAGCQYNADERRRSWEVLEIIEHEEQPLLPDRADDCRVGRFPHPLAHIERLRDHVRHEGRIAHGGERDEDDAVRHLRAYVVRDSDREPGLAHAARAGDRQEAHRFAAEHRRRLPHRFRAPDERRDLGRQIRWRRQHRRERGRQGALLAGGREETVTFLVGERERVSEQADRFAVRALLDAALDVPDCPNAEGRPFRQFLLRQARRNPVAQQQIADRRGMQRARCVTILARLPG